jgi:predicted small lipoprotein YifL
MSRSLAALLCVLALTACGTCKTPHRNTPMG